MAGTSIGNQGDGPAANKHYPQGVRAGNDFHFGDTFASTPHDFVHKLTTSQLYILYNAVTGGQTAKTTAQAMSVVEMAATGSALQGIPIWGWVQAGNVIDVVSGSKPSRSTAAELAAKQNKYQNPLSDLSGLFSGLTGSTSYSDPTQMQMYSAYENAYAVLDTWGLGSLADGLYAAVTQNHWINQKELMQWVRTQPAYAEQFPGLAEHNANGYTHMTEAEYQQNREVYTQQAQQYGLPSTFLTKQEIGKLVAGNVSPAEFSDRLVKGWAAVTKGDPQIQNELRRMYGIGKHDLMQYYFDPKNTVSKLEKQTVAGQVAAYAQETGLHELARHNAEQIARLVKTTGSASSSAGGAISVGAPYDFSQVRTAFTNAARDLPLTRTRLGTNGALNTQTTQNTLIGASLAGAGDKTTQVQKQAKVQKVQQAAMAPFEQGGGAAASDKGIFGAGHERM